MAPRSKCSLVGVECLAGDVSPFEVCACVSVCVCVCVCKNSRCSPDGRVCLTPQWPGLCANWPDIATLQPGVAASS